jgi:hypothetical protein
MNKRHKDKNRLVDIKDKQADIAIKALFFFFLLIILIAAYRFFQ